MLPIAIIICVALLLLVQRMIYRRRWYKDLDVDISFEQRRVIEREPIRLVVKVENSKKLPLPSLVVDFSLPTEFTEINTNDVVAIDSWHRNELFSLFSHQTATRIISFSCAQRGVYDLSGYSLNCHSLFLDEEYLKDYPLERRIFVYPAAVNNGKFIKKFQTLYGNILTNDFHYEDVFTIRGIREYQPFDSQKRINWTATAKLGQLMVNNYEFTTNRKVVIFLNLAMDLLSQERIIGEESIRLVKSWCMNLDKAGIQCNVYTNGVDFETGELVRIEKEHINKKYMECVNEGLSRIKIRDVDGRFSDEYRELMELYAKDHYVLVISAYQHEHFQKDLITAMAGSENYSWIIPVNTNSDYRPCEAIKKHAIAWDVYWRKEREGGLVTVKR